MGAPENLQRGWIGCFKKTKISPNLERKKKTATGKNMFKWLQPTSSVPSIKWPTSVPSSSRTTSYNVRAQGCIVDT